MRICWENHCWSSAATGSAATVLKKTSSCIMTRRASRTRKLIKVAHIICKCIAIWLKIMTVQVLGMKKECMVIATQVSETPTRVCHKCEITSGVLSSLNTFCPHWRFNFVNRWATINLVSYPKPANIFLVLCLMCSLRLVLLLFFLLLLKYLLWRFFFFFWGGGRGAGGRGAI